MARTGTMHDTCNMITGHELCW